MTRRVPISLKLCFFLTISILTTAANAAPTSNVVINEIMYQSGSGTSKDEFIEVLNNTPDAVNLSDWKIRKGVQFTFGSVVLMPGQFIVVAADLPTFSAKYPAVSSVVGPWTGTLSNSGETIELRNAANDLIDTVTYGNDGDWGSRTRGPNDFGHQGWIWVVGHDSGGRALELICASMPNDNGQNWAASTITGGTPGAPNSVRETGIAPLISQVQHSPIIPKSTETVRVTARIVDEKDVATTARVYYRTSGTFQFVPMYDDGTHGDAGVNDGIYGATLPTQSNNAVVEFYISATDETNSTRTWPAPSLPSGQQLTNCLYQVDDSTYSGVQRLFKLIMTESERAEIAQMGSSPGESQSNAAMHGTFISVDNAGIELRYRVSARNRGHSSRYPPPNNYRIDFLKVEMWNSAEQININAKSPASQYISSELLKKAGMPATASSWVQFRVNNTNLMGGTGSYAYNETLDGRAAKSMFPNDDNGNLYRGVRQDSGSYQADLAYRGSVPDIYRLVYPKETNTEADDWSDIIDLCYLVNNATDYYNQVSTIADVDEWCGFLAMNTWLVNTESSLSSGTGDDYAMYCGETDRRFRLLCYDMDSVMGAGGGSSSDTIWRFTSISALNRFARDQEIAPRYFETLNRYADTLFEPSIFNPFVDARLSGATATSMKNFIANRYSYIRGQIPLNLTVTTKPPTQSGYCFTNVSPITLAGRSNAIRTRSVRVNGAAASWVAWQANWTTSSVVLNPGINRVLIQSADGAGNVFESTYVDVWYDPGLSQDKSGPLASDTTFIAAGGPYHITGDLIVPAGVTLTIDPGTTLEFDAGFGIKVYGRLVANGTFFQRIRMTRVPGSVGAWAGIVYQDSTQDNSLGYVDFEYADSLPQNLHVANSRLLVDNTTWSNTLKQIIGSDNSTLTLQYSVLPAIDQNDLVVANGIPPAGYVRFIGNTFGGTTGAHDILKLSNANRPGPIFQIWNNTFTAGSDDGIELDAADAHIEGNTFTGIHKSNAGDSDSFAISTGTSAGADTCEITVCRNVFSNCDNGVLCKQNASATLQNNTFAGVGAAIGFLDEQGSIPAPGPGLSVTIDGNIFWNMASVLKNAVAGVTATITNSLIPTTDPALLNSGNSGGNVSVGAGNIVGDPNFISASDYHLRSGSPAIGAGPNGLDMGAHVRQGASISGVPLVPVFGTVTLRVNGPGIASYRYRVDGGALSSEIFVATPIVLSNLNEGAHTVAVSGKNDSGDFQESAPVSIAELATPQFTVSDAPVRHVRINEVLADNKSVHFHDNFYPDVIELFNDGSTIDLSDMSLSDDSENSRLFVFPPNTVLAAGQNLLVYADNNAAGAGLHANFSLSKDGETISLYETPARGGAVMDSVQFGLQLADRSIGRLADGSWSLCIPTIGATNLACPLGDRTQLKINEWLAAGNGEFADDFVELYNPDPRPVALDGLFLTDNVFGDPAKYEIPALTFADRYGFGVFFADNNPSAGANHLNFQLASDRSPIGLFNSDHSRIDDVLYGPQTLNISQGRSPNGAATIISFPPTPGRDNPLYSGISAIVINEVMTRPAAGGPKFVELYNPTGAGANVSGWYLTDDRTVPKKFKIASGVINSGSYLAFDDSHFGSALTLSPLGGEVYLFSADASDTLTGYSTGFSFGASDQGVSFGRHTISTGEVQYCAQLSPTQNSQNSGPRVGPVVIGEIMYNPAVGDNGYVELTNITGNTVRLYDPNNPANTWRINGLNYSLPQNIDLPAGGVLIVSSIDPASFRTMRSVPPNVQIVGPYSGTQRNRSELLELMKPDAPTQDEFGRPLVPYIVVDAVRYFDSPPWPTEADGNGASLERVNNSAYGNDPVNWRASVSNGTPGNAKIWDAGGDAATWSSDGNWNTNVRPASSAATTLVFPAAGPNAFTANNDLSSPFDLNTVIFSNEQTGNSISGGTLEFTGQTPAVLQYGGGEVQMSNNLALTGDLVLGGDGLGAVKLSGQIAGSGGVSKQGYSAFELSGANSYIGTTNVIGGALAVTNLSGSGTGTGSVLVSGGAALEGTGSAAGAVTIQPSGIIRPGGSRAGTLTLGSLTALESSVVEFDLGPISDRVVVAGNLNLGGVLKISPGAGFAFGRYTLFSYSGALTENSATVISAFQYAFQIDTSVQGEVALFISERKGPFVASVVRTGNQFTRAPFVDYTVTFNTSVSGVDLSDFKLAVLSGGITGASVTGVTQVSGLKYTVNVSTGSGDGVIRLDVVDDDTIVDAEGTPMGDVGAGTGNYSQGQTYIVDKTRSSGTVSIAAGQANPARALPVNFVIQFNEPIVDFTASGLVISGTAAAGGIATLAGTPDNQTFNIEISGLSSEGSLNVSLPADIFHDAAGNANNALAPAPTDITYFNTLNAHVLAVTTTTANGSYGVGKTIDIFIQFERTMTVTGKPRLALNSGANAYGQYQSGSGTDKLKFVYSIAAGDTSVRLDYVSASSLALNGGSIRDGDGLNGDLKLPLPGATGSLSKSSNIAIDTKPGISAITPDIGPPAGGTEVLITGKNLLGGTVTFGGSPGSTKMSTLTELRVVTPPHNSGRVTVTLSTSGGSDSKVNGFAFNTAPFFVSAPTVQPSLPLEGYALSIKVNAADPDADVITTAFDWGDGSNSATNAHTYESAGLYTVVVSISDGFNPPVTYTLSITVASPVPFTANALKCAFKFLTASSDSCQISGTLPNVSAGTKFSGKTVDINVGGATVTFTLDAKGKAKMSAGSFAVKAKFEPGTANFIGGTLPFTAKFTGGFADDWRDEGVDPEISMVKKSITMPSSVVFNGKAYAKKIPAALTSKAHKGGTISLVKTK